MRLTNLEAAPAGKRMIAYVEVADVAEEQGLPTAADATVHWLHRGDTPPGRSAVLVDTIRDADLPADPVYAWVAGEASAVRAVRRHLVNDRGIDQAADRVHRLLAPAPDPGRRPDPGGRRGRGRADG